MRGAGTLMAASAATIGLLGLGHLLLTFRGSKLRPRDRAVETAMAHTAPGITTQTTIWKMWLGFNCSHSMGALLFGCVYAYLGLVRPDVLFESLFLQALGLGMLGGFVALARIYWFVTPLAGSVVSLLLYIVSVTTARLA